MARFLPTINMWDAQTQTRVLSGELQLQPGQWIQCGPGPKSRYSGVTSGGTIVATHAERDGNRLVVKTDRFMLHLDYWRSHRSEKPLNMLRTTGEFFS